jgi:ribosomal protein S18 acetylase RimI-like enzyme
MEIRELTSLDDIQWRCLDVLMKQLDDEKTVTRSMFQDVIDDPGSHLYALFDGDRIAGCATFSVYYSPTGRKACVEDVVVHTDYRGQHLGRALLEHIISEARKMSPIEIHLTSRPVRVAANALYQSLGFVKRDTNFYKMVV